MIQVDRDKSDVERQNRMLAVLDGKLVDRVPVWIMRQAGRYLPEYRALRASSKSFLDFCYTPDLAVEATLQPIRRFDLDAAIIFSDILVVPHALGQKVWFVEGEGPRLEALDGAADTARLSASIDLEFLRPVLEALTRTRAELPSGTALLGFCGAPWTLAGYMIAGRGGAALEDVRIAAYRDPVAFDALLARLVAALTEYLIEQLRAGADAVQIFESFAGAIPPAWFERWSLAPVRAIVAGVRAAIPDARILVFARGAGLNHVEIAKLDGVSAVGLDWTVDPVWASRHVQPLNAVQGNLDPLAVVAGGTDLDHAVDRICGVLSGAPARHGHIFNFGHGIVPQTPIAHVERVIERVRAVPVAARLAA